MAEPDTAANNGKRTIKARMAAWLVWTMWALSVALLIGRSVLLAPVNTFFPDSMPLGLRFVEDVLGMLTFGAFSTLGVFIVARRPDNLIGWIFCGAGLAGAFDALAGYYALYTLVINPGSLPLGWAAGWLQNWIWLPAVSLILIFLPLFFPTGRLLSDRWRPVAWFAAVLIAIQSPIVAFQPGPLRNYFLSLPQVQISNPLGIEEIAMVTEPVSVVLGQIGPILLLVSTASLILRLGRATGEERQQVKWFAYFGALAALMWLARGLVVFVLNLSVPWFDALSRLSFGGALFGLPIATGIAVLKYRLYDIDLIINRTLVYVPLTAILAGIYTASITASTKLFPALTGEKSDAAIVLTTLVVVSAFTPLKNSLQGLVDKRLKEVRDSTKELTAFGEQVRAFVQMSDAEQCARRLLDEVARAFGAKSGAVYLGSNEQLRLIHTFGEWKSNTKVSVPIESDGRRYGLVTLGPRRHGLEYTPKDRETFEQTVGLVARAIRLAERAK